MSCYATYAYRDGVKVFPVSSTALLRFRPDDKPISVEDSRQTRDEYWAERHLYANQRDVEESLRKIKWYGGMIAADDYPLSWRPCWPCQEHRDTCLERIIDLSLDLTLALANVEKYEKLCGF